MTKTFVETLDGCVIYSVGEGHSKRFLVQLGPVFIGKGLVSGGYKTINSARRCAYNATTPYQG